MTLVEDVSVFYAVFFVVYVAGVIFALTRIITALFLKDTMAVANSDENERITQHLKEKQRYAKKLLQFFHEADDSGDGFVTESEFQSLLREPRAMAYLSNLDIEPHESSALFHDIDNGDGRISAEEFVNGAMRLKGCARARDVVALLHHSHLLLAEMKSVRQATNTTQVEIRNVLKSEVCNQTASPASPSLVVGTAHNDLWC